MAAAVTVHSLPESGCVEGVDWVTGDVEALQ